jgi:hypothetical protein
VPGIDELRQETIVAMRDAGDEEPDVSHIGDATQADVDEAQDPGEEVLSEHLSRDPAVEAAEAGGTVDDINPAGWQLIYGHSIVRIGSAIYFKLVSGSNGTGSCLNSSYYRWPAYNYLRWVNSCSGSSVGKYQIGRNV